MSGITDRLERVRRRIEQAAHSAGRDPAEVRLIAVSKTFPVSYVLEAARAGIDAFGENRVQEAAQKIPQVRQELATLEWHLVGRLQRNKARKAVELFDVIHSIDRLELARALDRAASELDRCVRVLLQVNLDQEPQKGGAKPEELRELLKAVDSLGQLEPCGLMILPRACSDPEEVRPSFARTRSLLEELNRGRPAHQRLKELSMGMSADYEVAVQEGATWIRIGTAIFGEREKT